MAKPKFSWEVYDETYSLILKVTEGDREIIWRIGPRPNTAKLGEVFLDIAEALGALDQTTTAIPLVATRPAEQDQDPAGEPQQSEEASKEQLAAKATAVGKTGGNWFANLDQDTELPIFTIGHGGEPG